MEKLEIQPQTTFTQRHADNMNAIIEKIDEIVVWINQQAPSDTTL